jgi:hypothetical protein
VQQGLFPKVKQPGLEADPPLHLVPRLRMYEAIPPLSHMPVRQVQGHYLLTLHPVIKKSGKMYFKYIYFPCLLFALYS